MKIVKLIGLTWWLCATLLIIGCGESEEEKASRLKNTKITEEFKKSPRFTLNCKGDYYNKDKDGNGQHGTQSLSVTIDPQNFVAHFFNFQAYGHYSSTQENMNDEIKPVIYVTEDRINVGGLFHYLFNRKTMKYTFNDIVKGICTKSSITHKIPVQVL